MSRFSNSKDYNYNLKICYNIDVLSFVIVTRYDFYILKIKTSSEDELIFTNMRCSLSSPLRVSDIGSSRHNKNRGPTMDINKNDIINELTKRIEDLEIDLGIALNKIEDLTESFKMEVNNG